MKVVLGFSCGYRNKEEPGLSNEAMARTIQHLNPDVVSVQIQIGLALRKLGIVPNHEVSQHRKPNRHYVDTEEVARQMLVFLSEQGLQNETVLVVAHPLHMPRCINVFRKLSIQSTIHGIYAIVPCDSQSAHFWTRAPFLIRAHEILGFPIFLLRGYYNTTA
ncbi:MAG: hypothetical protein A3D67_02925 [Candidatus Lloydbacteria bacterium RIFCSPHIGHO2_02_FULL_51_22]|nr:MAG: hypothetical protein A3D67_02925 [Candidatus Lloydbacteria bacterium RIFCSPHIGHO2_02_FULL_51_22]